jgi:hypothetical protein
MSSNVYFINRGINQSIEFRGLKAQYILHAACIVVADLLLFILLYISGLSPWIYMPVCFGLGGGGIVWCYRSSLIYGEFGRAKKRAALKVPKMLRHDSRSPFIQLNYL